MRKKAVLKYFAVILAIWFSCGAVADCSRPSTQRAQSDELGTYHRDEARILDYLRPALNATATAVQLSYAAKCVAGTNVPPIPLIRLQKAPKADRGFRAVRTIFQGNGNIAVTEGPDGIVRVRIGNVPAELLRTHIRVFSLQPIEQYNPSSVLSALEDTKEMRSAIVALGLRPATVLHMQLRVLPQKGLPHFPAVLQDVTVGQVLDLLSVTFKGVVAYGICTQGPPGRPLFISYVDVTQ
jgi:hypothetical protein